MKSRKELHQEMLLNWSRWAKERVTPILISGYHGEVVPGCGIEKIQNSQLAICNHLFYLCGVESALEYPIHIGSPPRQIYLDIWIPLALLNIELDGVQHTFEANARSDHNRDTELKSSGIEVLRFTNRDVWHNFPSVIRTIRNSCAAREHRFPETFSPLISVVGTPTTHYLCIEEQTGSETVIGLHSQQARDMGLEFHMGQRTF